MTIDEAVKHLEAGEIVYRVTDPKGPKVKAYRKGPNHAELYQMRYEWPESQRNAWLPAGMSRDDVLATDWEARDGD